MVGPCDLCGLVRLLRRRDHKSRRSWRLRKRTWVCVLDATRSWMGLSMGWILLAILPQPVVAADQVWSLERNHFFDENGGLVFVQIIGREPDWRVRFWILEKENRVQKEFPSGYVLRFDDNGLIREIRASHFYETWTQYDPELLDRELLPKEKRRHLGGKLR